MRTMRAISMPINVMLELFGSCEIVLHNLERLVPPAVERVNWLMLPPGEHPWERIETHIRGVFGRLTPSVVASVLARQAIILRHNPNTIYRGAAGFSDYLAYDFTDRGLVVLESVRYGNALYIFGSDWEAVSRLTKAEIIQTILLKNASYIQRVGQSDWLRLLANLAHLHPELANMAAPSDIGSISETETRKERRKIAETQSRSHSYRQ